MVYLTLPFFRSLFPQVVDDAVVENDVRCLSQLDRTISAFAAQRFSTEMLYADVHLSSGRVNEMTQTDHFSV
jgi:hypothetical protein